MPFEVCPPERFLEDVSIVLTAVRLSPARQQPRPPAAVREAAPGLSEERGPNWSRNSRVSGCPAVGRTTGCLWMAAFRCRSIARVRTGGGADQEPPDALLHWRGIPSDHGLPEGCRTSVFRTHKSDFHSAYSWYVQLREDRELKTHRSETVRVEAKPGPEAIRRADAISAWILAERCPVSPPTAGGTE